MALNEKQSTYDPKTVEAFNDQWRVFENRQGTPEEQKIYFDEFFTLFPKDLLNQDSKGYEVGCGTGRFAQFVAPYVQELTLIDVAPLAIEAAKRTLKEFDNCNFILSPIEEVELPKETMDFGYSYGVLHHTPNTQESMQHATRFLKKGAPFLVYLYYGFDNRPKWFVAIWKLSEILRWSISKMPHGPRHVICDILALTLYWPLARLAKLGNKLGLNTSNWPLSAYADSTIRRLRNNCRDRFGTPLEQRFTRAEIKAMMEKSDLEKIEFMDHVPYWTAIGYKK